MARPFIKKDDYWSDAINSLLLRPPYRKKLDPENKTPRKMGLQIFVDHLWKLIPEDSDDAWTFFFISDQWWVISAISDDKGQWDITATDNNLEECLRKLYKKIKTEYPERESKLK